MKENNNKKIKEPFLSIVITVWNREAEISRCIDSVISQDFQDYEIVAVDDGSEDNSVKVLESYKDLRLKLFEHKENKGMWGARNTGIEISRGRWILILDSDDALLPGALKWFCEKAKSAGPDIGVIGACYKDDKGRILPESTFPEGPFGLLENVKWLEKGGGSDYLRAVRKDVFETVKLPPSRGHGRFMELEIFKKWKKEISSQVCGTIYTDAVNRNTGKGTGFSMSSFLTMAKDRADVNEQVIDEYGDFLKRHAPKYLLQIKRGAGMLYFSAGNRIKGLKYTLMFLLKNPSSIKSWGVLLTGIIGPRFLVKCRNFFGRFLVKK